jgi:hypothetical protein
MPKTEKSSHKIKAQFSDEQIEQATKIVRTQGAASPALLQRRLNLGRRRARALISKLQKRGILCAGRGQVWAVVPAGPPPNRASGNGELTKRRAVGARAGFLASNPKARELQDAQLADFRRRFAQFQDGLEPMLRGFIHKAEQARQIGFCLIEFVDTLPGKELTRDFYAQLKSEFVDATGSVVSYELLHWFMRVARANPEPITDFRVAVRWRQPLLITVGQEEFAFEGEREPQFAQAEPDPLCELKRRFDFKGGEFYAALREDPRYCPGGHIREDLRPILRLELEPKLKIWDEVRLWLRQEIGV